MNQINQSMNHINKKISKILNITKHNSTFSSYKLNQNPQEKSYQREPIQDSFKNVKNIGIYDMIINKSFDAPVTLFNHSIDFQNFSTETEKTKNKELDKYKKEELEENLLNESDDDFNLVNTDNSQTDIKLSDQTYQNFNDDEQYDLRNEGEVQDDLKITEFEDYITSLNNIFTINTQLQ